MNEPNASPYLTLSDVLARLHISRTTLHELRKGDFPKAVALTPGRKLFLRSQVEQWEQERASR